MRKPGRHPELAMIFLRQFGAHPLPERGGTLANVDSHVEYGAPSDPHQFALRKWRQLVVQAAQHAAPAAAVVVLDKLRFSDGLRPGLRVIALHEKSTLIPKNLRLNDQDTRNFCFNKLHTNSSEKSGLQSTMQYPLQVPHPKIPS